MVYSKHQKQKNLDGDKKLSKGLFVEKLNDMERKKIALIFWVTGQDASYLSIYLINEDT